LAPAERLENQINSFWSNYLCKHTSRRSSALLVRRPTRRRPELAERLENQISSL
jgi:hypothetical protein